MSDQVERKISRRELYERVWAKPTREVAKEFGVSDVALAKACRKAEIPIPERGYWARKSAGKPSFQRPLPPRFPGASEEVRFGPRHEYYYARDWRRKLLERDIPPEPTFDESIESVTERVRKLVGRVKPEKNFDRADPLISRVLAHDDERRKQYEKWHWASDLPKYEVGIERRRLLVLNSLFLAFRRCGCHPDMSISKYAVINNSEERIVSVTVGDTNMNFSIEPLKPKRGGKETSKREPLRLAFGYASRQTDQSTVWDDREHYRIESYLTDFVVAIIVGAEERHRASLVAHRKYLIEERGKAIAEVAAEKAEQERLAREAREREERQRVTRLLSQATMLQKAETIRDYVRRVQGKAASLQPNDDALMAWSKWALSEADRIDPTKNGSILSAAQEFALLD